MRRANQTQQPSPSLPSRQQGGSGLQRQQEVNDQLFHRVQEMFEGKVDGEVVFMVLQEFEFNVHRAVESLSQMCGEVLDAETKKSRLAMIARDVLCSDNDDKRVGQSTQNLLPSEFPALTSSNPASPSQSKTEERSVSPNTQGNTPRTPKSANNTREAGEVYMSGGGLRGSNSGLSNVDVSTENQRLRQPVYSIDHRNIINNPDGKAKNIGVIGQRPSGSKGDNSLSSYLEIENNRRSRSTERPAFDVSYGSSHGNQTDMDYWSHPSQQQIRKSQDKSSMDIAEFPSFHDDNNFTSSHVPPSQLLYQGKKAHSSMDDIDDINDELEFSRSSDSSKITQPQMHQNLIGQSILSGALKLSDFNKGNQTSGDVSTSEKIVGRKQDYRMSKNIGNKQKENENPVLPGMSNISGDVTIDSYWLSDTSTARADESSKRRPDLTADSEKLLNTSRLLGSRTKEGFVSPVAFMENSNVTDFVRDSTSPGFSRYSFANKSVDSERNDRAAFLAPGHGKKSERHDSSDFDDIDKILKESYSKAANLQEENTELGGNEKQNVSKESARSKETDFQRSESTKKFESDLKSMLKIDNGLESARGSISPDNSMQDKSDSGKMQLPVVSFELSATAKEFVPRFQKQDAAVETGPGNQPTFLTPKMVNSQQEKVSSTTSPPRMPVLHSGYPPRVPFSVPVGQWPSPRGPVGRGIPWPPPTLPPPPFPSLREPPPPIGNQNYIAPVKKVGPVHQQHIDRNRKPQQNVAIESSEVGRVKKKILDGTKCLVLLRGLPGSGKSTLAREVKGEGKVLTTDDYFVKNGVYQYDPSKLSAAHEWNRQRAVSAFEENVNPIIVDNTNTQVWEMKPYVKLAQTYGYDIEILEPNTDWKFNVKELTKRNTHGVPQETIQRMKERYQKNIVVEHILGYTKSTVEKKTGNRNQVQEDNHLDIRLDTSESEFPRIERTVPIPLSKEPKNNGPNSSNDDHFSDKDLGWGDEVSSIQNEFDTDNSGWGDPVIPKDKFARSRELNSDVLSQSSDNESEKSIESELLKKSETRQSPVPGSTAYGVRSVVGVSPVNLHRQLEMITKRKMLMSPPVMAVSPVLKMSSKEVESEASATQISSSSTMTFENKEETCDEVEKMVNDLIKEHVGNNLKTETDCEKTVDELKAFLHIMPIDPNERPRVENMIEEKMKEMIKKFKKHRDEDKTDENKRVETKCTGVIGHISHIKKDNSASSETGISQCKVTCDSDTSNVVGGFAPSDQKVTEIEISSTVTDDSKENDVKDVDDNNDYTAAKLEKRESLEAEIKVDDVSLSSESNGNKKLSVDIQKFTENVMKDDRLSSDFYLSGNSSTGCNGVNVLKGDNLEEDFENMEMNEEQEENEVIDEVKKIEALYWSKSSGKENKIPSDSNEMKNDENFTWDEPQPRRQKRQSGKAGRKGDETQVTVDENISVDDCLVDSSSSNTIVENSKKVRDENITERDVGKILIENDKEADLQGHVSSVQSLSFFPKQSRSSSPNSPTGTRNSPPRNDNTDIDNNGISDTLETLASGQTSPKKKRKTSKRKMAAKLPFFNENDVQKFTEADWSDLSSTMKPENKVADATNVDKVDIVKDLFDFGSEITDDDLRFLNLVNKKGPLEELSCSCRILVCRNRDINRDSSIESNASSKDDFDAVRQSVNSKWMVDRGIMTEESNDADIEFLKKSFPMIKEQDLKDVVGQCGDDMHWAANILLDWKYDLYLTEEDKEKFVEAMFKVQGVPLSRTIPSTMNSVTSESSRSYSKPESLLDLCCECLELNNIASKSDIEHQIISSSKRRLNSIEEKIRHKRLNSFGPDDIFEEDNDFGDAILSELVAIAEKENENSEVTEATGAISDKLHHNSYDPSIDLNLTGDYPETDCHPMWNYRQGGSEVEGEDLFKTDPYKLDSLDNDKKEDTSRESDLHDSGHTHTVSLLPLTLPKDFTQALVSLFGPIADLHSGNASDVSIVVDYKTAKHLHHCMSRGFSPGHVSDQQLVEDEELARKLQAEMNETNTLINATGSYGWHGNKTGREAHSFEDIMREQKNAEERRRELQIDMKATGSHNLLANKLKKKQLYEEFPGIDETVLDDLYEANCYHLDDTIKAIRGFLGSSSSLPQNLKTQGGVEAYEKKLIDAAKQQSLQEMVDSCLYHPRVSKNFQAIENPEYEDYRGEANIHYRLRHECFQKAQEAFRRGMRQVATFYSNQGHLHTQKIKEANMRAAEKILAKRNNALENNSTLDLHGLHVDEAVTSLDRVITERVYELQSHPDKRREVLFIITGRGAHSRGGVAKIRPCVISYLKRNNYRFTEVHQGLLKVNLRNRLM